MPNRRKPISFDTTLRNPERIPQFVSILSKYENQIMTSDVALELESEIIRQKIYEPTKATLGTYMKEYHDKFEFYAADQSKDACKKVESYYEEWKNAEASQVEKEKIMYLLKNTITAHKEANWAGGWESRIHTQFNFLNELGLVRVAKDKKIIISDNGKMMIKSYENGFPIEETYDPTYEQSAFLNAFAKYQTNNPYRRNTISVNVFALILNVIRYLDKKYNKSGISIQDLSFIIVWDNNDYETLAEYIYRFRETFGYNTSDEMLYEYAMNLLDESTSNTITPATQEFIENKRIDYKMSKIMKETPDDVIRKLRYSMLISLRGAGRFIDINSNEEEKIEYIISNYSNNISFDDEDSFIEYMGSIDSKLLFETDKQENEEQKTIKEKLIEAWAVDKDWDYIKKELQNLSNKRESDDFALRYIKETARLEFLIAITVKKALPNIKVVANYVADDQGFPFNTALGRNGQSIGADIDVYENNVHALFEPTLARSYSFQVEHELPSISKHLIETASEDVEEENYNEWFAIFVAPSVNGQVGNTIAVMKFVSGVEIYPWTIEDFVLFSQNVTSIKDFKCIRPYAEAVTMPNIREL